MDYDSLLKELYGLERFGIKLGLETITELLGHMGNPHRRFKTVHVTGTNGKGSVCAFVASVLRKAGYRVGLYTSPHLVRFNERIQVDGREISNADVARIYAEMGPAIAKTSGGSKVKQPTFFEVTTAMAFHYFAERQIDIGVIEVGMGGRMDATNVIHPLVAVLTRIGLEHTEHLGKTEERIARMGLPISEEAIVAGVKETTWGGRLQIVRSKPTVIVDGTHNAPGVPTLSTSLRELFPREKPIFVLGVLEDKDLKAFADHLGPLASRLLIARPDTPRAYPPEEIARAFAAHVKDPLIIPKVSEAVDRAVSLAGPDGLVVITGSIYTAGEALAHLQGR